MNRINSILVAVAVALLAAIQVDPAAAQDDSVEAEPGLIPGHVEFGGVVQLSASHEQSYGGGSTTSTAAEQLELGIGIELHKWVGTEVIWIHEHEDEEAGDEHGHDLGFLTATVIVGPHEGSWWLKGGVQFLPFTLFELASVHAVHDATIGPFESSAIVDPLSFEYGEKLEKSLQLGVSVGQFEGSLFGFYGDDPRSSGNRAGYGAAIGYKDALDNGAEFAVNLSFIDDLGGLDLFAEELFEETGAADGAHLGSNGNEDDAVPGWAAATQFAFQDLTVTGEFMIAQERFSPSVLTFGARGARPSVWVLEAGYAFELAGRSGEVVLASHGTSEAAGLALPASRFVAALNVDLWNERLIGTVEWVRDSDYGTSHDGTGGVLNTYTAQMGIEF